MKNSKLYRAPCLSHDILRPPSALHLRQLSGCAAMPEGHGHEMGSSPATAQPFTGGGVAVNNDVVTISAAGGLRQRYARQRADSHQAPATRAMKVTLTLNNASITCLDAPAIMVERPTNSSLSRGRR